MSGRQFTDRDIHMALDGEMPADEQGDFEAWLSVNPDKKALSTRIVEDRRRLREALEPVLREPVPEALRKLVEGDQPAPARRTGWWRLAAAAALLAVGGGAGYALGLSGWKPVGSDGAIIAEQEFVITRGSNLDNQLNTNSIVSISFPGGGFQINCSN